MKHIHVTRSIIIGLMTCLFVSCQKEPDTIAVTGITLSQTSVEITEGESTHISATVSPSNATNKTVIWSSDNPYVTVSDGTITGTKPCSATVTAKSDDGGKTATCSVRVVARVIHVSSVSLDNTSLTLTEGDTQSLTATVSPSDATDPSVTWSSDNESVATVSSSGVVLAKAPGKATITVKSNDGGKVATCSVTVQAKIIAVTGVSLDETSLIMTEGDTHTLTVTVSPSDATDKSVTWSSNAPSVVEVSSTGIVIARSEGSATITVKTTDGGKTASCSVVVNKKVIPVSSITLNKTSLALTKGQSETLIATVNPSDATDKKVTWSSSNTSVAAVDQNGNVTAIAGGSATIAAKVGDKQATCTVTVTVPVASVTLNKTSLALIKGQSETLTATVKPDDATEKTVTWSSSNTSIVTVDQSGKVTAVAGGSATITAKASDKQATCAVTVTVPVSSITLNKSEITLFTGESETLKVTVKPDDATDKTVTWTSSNTGVAAVNGGVVFAISVGRTTITASVGNQSASCSVVVYQSGSYIDEYGVNRGQGITVSGITWAPVNCGYKEASGGTKGFIYGKLYQWGRKSGQGYGKPFFNSSDTYEDESTPNIASTWTGNNEDADVNTFYYGSNDPYNWINQNTSFWNDGTESNPKKDEVYDPCPKGWRVPTVSELSTLAYGYRSDLVTNNGVYGIWYSGNSLYSESLTNKVFLPASGSRFADNWYHGCGALARGSSGAYWSSSLDGGRAYNYDINGSLGTAYRAFGLAVRCCKDEVVQIVQISSLSFTQGSFSVEEGDQLQLNVVIQPQNATCKAVFWSSSKESVAKVSSKGIVSALSEGQVTITASAGGKTATCTISVKKKVIEVTSISLDKTSLELTKGETRTLVATVNPDNATDKKVTWSSSNTGVATVDQNGKVTAIASGSATITAKAGDKQATCTVTVKVPVTSVTLNKTELKLKEGSNETLIATVGPDDATNKTVVWSSSNTKVVTVDQNGKVTAISAGTATITVTTNDGSKKATCKVTVPSSGNTEPIVDDGNEQGWD